MRLSTRAEYGVRAMVVLALEYGCGSIPLRKIAQRERISYQYLEQIFPLLKKAGLVDSVRGRYGGYQLARGPSRISVGDIIRAVEGPIAPARCVARGLDHGQPKYCKFPEDCVSRRVWIQLRDHIVFFVDGIFLEDMVNWSRERARMKVQ